VWHSSAAQLKASKMKETKQIKKLLLNKKTVSVLKDRETLYLKGGIQEAEKYCGTNQGCTSQYAMCGGSCFQECPVSLPSYVQEQGPEAL
jgi:hypothetical protein